MSPPHPTRLLPALLLLLLPSLTLAQGPLSLDGALDLAMESPAVLAAELELAESERSLALASGLLSGQLSAGFGATVGERTAPSLAEPQSLDETDFDPIRLDLSFNVVPYGPSHDSVVAAEEQLVLAQLALRDARSDAAIDAVEQLLAAQRAAEEVAVARFALAVAAAELEATEARFEGGTAPSTQLTQAQLAQRQAENELVAAELAASQSLRTLSATLGAPVAAVAPPAVDAIDVPLPEGAPGDEDLLRRSDVQRALASLSQVERSAAATLRANLPSGSLGVSYGYSEEGFGLSLGASFDTRTFQPSVSASVDPDGGGGGGVPDAVTSSLSLSVGLTVPLDSALGDALALSELARDQALLAFEQTLTSARLALLLSADRVASIEVAADLAAEQVVQAEEALAIAGARLELGLVSQLDVLSAERSLLEQRLRAGRADDSLLLARLSHLRALALDPLEVF